MSRDTTYYTDPEDFRPERFLQAEPELDPNMYMFGFGRRQVQCPSRHSVDPDIHPGRVRARTSPTPLYISLSS